MNEKVVIENTLKLLRKGKFELEGEEALAFYSMFSYWVKRLQDLNKPPVQVVQSTSTIKPATEPSVVKKSKKSK
jgi:hypothetical protein